MKKNCGIKYWCKIRNVRLQPTVVSDPQWPLLSVLAMYNYFFEIFIFDFNHFHINIFKVQEKNGREAKRKRKGRTEKAEKTEGTRGENEEGGGRVSHVRRPVIDVKSTLQC